MRHRTTRRGNATRLAVAVVGLTISSVAARADDFNWVGGTGDPSVASKWLDADGNRSGPPQFSSGDKAYVADGGMLSVNNNFQPYWLFLGYSFSSGSAQPSPGAGMVIDSQLYAQVVYLDGSSAVIENMSGLEAAGYIQIDNGSSLIVDDGGSLCAGNVTMPTNPEVSLGGFGNPSSMNV